jgi:putative hydrolase of the HAD superfamily
VAVDAIIFDFDGTIIDTESADYQAWQEVFHTHGLTIGVELWKQRVGKVYTENGAEAGVFEPHLYFEQLAGRPLTSAERAAQYERYMQLCAELPILPGVIDILEKARAAGIRLAIASNSDYEWVEKWARHYRVWDYFEAVVTREQVAKPKPAPDIYLEAARRLGVPVERCIAIEDSPVGMEAVLAAGMRCIGVPNWLTVHLERPAVTLSVNALTEIGYEGIMARF